jgi:hypothetical protein
MAEPQREADGFYHPGSDDEVAALIAMASRKGLLLRVRGSGHSVPGAITGPDINVMLDRLNEVEFGKPGPDGRWGARVQAGCHLGEDPLDPTSTLNNSFLFQLDGHTDKGGALADLGGITHQTIGGFLSTGSSGGSLQFSLEDQVTQIRLLDGTGKYCALRPGDEDFDAAGVSMGLLGVVLAVDFEPTIPRFCIEGQEAITTTGDCAIDLFGQGTPTRPSLERFLRETPYTRLMWWPQPEVDKVVVWQARRIDWTPGFVRHPYREMGASGIDMNTLPPDLVLLAGRVTGSVLANRAALIALAGDYIAGLPENLRALASQIIADLQAGRIDKIPEAVDDLVSLGLQIVIDLYFTLLGNRHVPGSLAETMFREIFESDERFERHWSPLVMNDLFLVADKDKPGKDRGKPQTFQDLGYRGLPMDNQIADRLLPTVFTELWIPIERTREVMTDLRDFYVKGGYASTGTYACEIYGARASRFWMSPAYGHDVVRIDVFWFARNAEPPDQAFFPQFWRLLAKHDFRPHWGKYLPPPDSSTGVGYLRKNYPRWDDFMRRRAAHDPGQIFVTDYWRRHLGIARSG